VKCQDTARKWRVVARRCLDCCDLCGAALPIRRAPLRQSGGRPPWQIVNRLERSDGSHAAGTVCPGW
jgi:hypothetical protein